MSVCGASRAKAASCCASRWGRGPWRSSDQSASWCSLPRSKTTRRASTPFRRRAWTFSHGIPAMFTGQCVTRSPCGKFVTLSLRRLATGLVSRRPVRRSLVEFELVEVAEGCSTRADAGALRPELLVGDLAECALHAEVGEVEILLVDDGRDAGVDLDHVLADELDVEEVLDPELRDDQVRDAHQLVVLERHEVHREARARSLPRLGVAEHDLPAVADPVDRSLAAGRELHHEQ